MNPRVLVADDNRLIREVTKAQLIRCGALVSLASNGIEAMEQMKTHHFDVALLDIRMPLLGGLELAIQIRATPGDYHSVPILVGVSASDKAEQRKRCLEAGMDDYLCKPVWEQDLSEGLARWCIQTERPILGGSEPKEKAL